MAAVKANEKKLKEIADKAEAQIKSITIGDLKTLENKDNDFETAFLQLIEKKTGQAEQYKKEIEAAGGFSEFENIFIDRLTKLFDDIAFKPFREALIDKLTSIKQHKLYAELQARIEEIKQEQEEKRRLIGDKDGELAPFINEILDENSENPIYEGVDVIKVINAATNPNAKGFTVKKREACKEIYKQAEEYLEDFKTAAAFMEFIASFDIPTTEKINKILYSEKINYAMDSMSTKGFWKAEKTTPGQLKMSFKEDTICTIIDFDAIPVEFSRKLTSYDKQIYSAIDTLYMNNNAANKSVTLTATAILKQAGITDKPSKTQIEKLIKSIRKMLFTAIIINDNSEKRLKWTNQLLKGSYIEGSNFEVQGGRAEAAIIIDQEPILFQFARLKEQITTVPRKLIAETQISKTDQNLSIMQYLIERIARMKNFPNNTRTILFDSLFKSCDIKIKQTRKKGDISKILQTFKSEEFIKDFAIDDRAINIIL